MSRTIRRALSPKTGVVAFTALATSALLAAPTTSLAATSKTPAAASRASQLPKAGPGRAITCPAHSLHVSPGHVPAIKAKTAYCFAAGTYSRFSVTPQSHDGFFGGKHAVLDGGSSLTSAFSTSSSISHLAIDGFTMQNYSSSSHDQVPGVIELQNGSHVRVSNNTIKNDRTSGVSWGGNTGAPCCDDHTAGISYGEISHNLITNIGYSGTTVSGGTDDTISDNDVSHTDMDNVDTEIDVAAVGKFAVDDGTVVRGNYIHDNNDTAMWFDDYNTNSTIEYNRVGPDNRVGIFYEISLNAVISHNIITSNGQADAGQGTGAPGAGIRVSSSGSSLQSPSPSPTLNGPRSITVSHNRLIHNHEGITLFDGHENNDGTPIYDNNITVSRNETVGDNTSTASDSDAWLAHTAPAGHKIVWGNNSYRGGSSRQSSDSLLALDSGPTNYAGWQARGLDISGSSCHTASGATC